MTSITAPRSVGAPWRRAVMLGALLLSITALPRPAAAFTFSLVGDGSSQNLNWLREGCTSFTTGSAWAVNGQIPLTTGGGVAGGQLSWETTPGTLKVVAYPVAWASGSGASSCAGAWGAVDARSVPLVFSILPQPGDPLPLVATLQIVPRLVGTVEAFTNPGGQATLWLQLAMRVAVDGQVASADSLWGTFAFADSADLYWQVSFPKGGANSTLVADVTPGSDITITLWAYMRANVTGSATIDGFSSYGNGPAIEITVRDLNAVDVPEEVVNASLSLAARPNPSAGPCQVQYNLPRRSPIRLTAYDLRGRRVATLVDRFEEAGSHEIHWDGRGARGERLAAGVYLVELIAGAERSTGKVVLLGR